jgi:ribosomal protein S18 acetylase RimI-like enzyme
MKIIEVDEFSNEYLDAIQRLICMLTPEPYEFTEADYKALLASGSSHLFLLKDEHSIIGMFTVGIYRSPTGSKAWIEDVVVDEAYRGKGLGRLLTQYAIDFAKSQRVDLLMLTSNPSRIAANKLYQTVGFERKETNVYRIKF